MWVGQRSLLSACVVAALFACSLADARAEQTPVAEARYPVDWRDLGEGLAPGATPEQRAFSRGYIAATFDTLPCHTNQKVVPPVDIPRNQETFDLLAKTVYEIYLEQRERMSGTPRGLIPGIPFVTGAAIRLWNCSLN
jgi:hypothetical protein